LVLDLEEALRKYESIRKERSSELEELKEEYWNRAEETIKEILENIDDLENRESPRNVDETLLRIALRDRSRYVTSMRRILGEISSMEELGRKLPEVTKFHVSMGRYLLVVFEKDMRTINSLMKQLGELHAEYSNEVSSKELPDVDVTVRQLLDELRKIEEERKELEEKVKEEEERIRQLKGLLSKERGSEDQEVSNAGEVVKKARTLRIQIRSKVSKLQKPLKRMRIPEAKPFIENSAFAIENPDEFLSMLTRVYPKLEGKYKSVARWAIENLKNKVNELEELEKQVKAAQERKEKEEQEVREIRRKIQDVEREIKRIRNNVHKLTRKEESIKLELEKRVKEMEDVLGEEVELKW